MTENSASTIFHDRTTRNNLPPTSYLFCFVVRITGAASLISSFGFSLLLTLRMTPQSLVLAPGSKKFQVSTNSWNFMAPGVWFPSERGTCKASLAICLEMEFLSIVTIPGLCKVALSIVQQALLDLWCHPNSPVNLVCPLTLGDCSHYDIWDRQSKLVAFKNQLFFL